jgi:signal transduction histidine kinase
MKEFQPLQSNGFPAIFVRPSTDGSMLIPLLESVDGAHESISCASDESMTPRLCAWLALALQVAEIGAWEWNVATGQFHVSTQWSQSFGYVGRHVAPRTLRDWRRLIHLEDRPTFDGFASALIDGSGTARQAEIRLQRPDGSYGWQRCSGQALGGGGPSRRAIGVMVDVTTKHETMSRLSQIERLETIGQLTGGLAHDFNNLLTVIQGNVDLLNDSLGDDALNAPILEEIGTIVDRGAALTRRLLSFARDERAPAATLDPDALAIGLLPLLNHTLDGRVALHQDLAADGWLVDADARQFENAIINLAINARDAMPGGGTLTISTRTASLTRADSDAGVGSYVMVAISDTGQGMSPEVQARIFEPFFTTKADKGTGLGIPMVARFVRQAGGHIRIESTVGSGTTVRLYIPRSAAPI